MTDQWDSLFPMSNKWVAFDVHLAKWFQHHLWVLIIIAGVIAMLIAKVDLSSWQINTEQGETYQLLKLAKNDDKERKRHNKEMEKRYK